MFESLKQLDRILRGDATQLDDLRRGQLEVRVRAIAFLLIVLAVFYGACVGSYAVVAEEGPGIQQVVASAVKMPLLFLLTTIVTLPSLYVYNALVGSRLSIHAVARVLVASLGVTIAIAASQGPIVVFFGLSTTSYPFMILLNVVSLGVAGLLGLAFLNRTLTRLVYVQLGVVRQAESSESRDARRDSGESANEAESGDDADAVRTDDRSSSAPSAKHFPSALDTAVEMQTRQSTLVFRVWLFVFGLVGAQMSWVLRPFIGSPDLEFSWFRPREASFFEGVLRALGNLFGG